MGEWGYEKEGGGRRGRGGRREGVRGLGRWGGRACLIDSVNRSAGDVNDWTIPFPRSVGQVAMPCPGPI